MYCTQCGTATADDANFCGNCGAPAQYSPNPNAHRAEQTSAPTQTPRAETDVAQVRPWVRYWARMFDIYLACMVGGFTIGIMNPDVPNDAVIDQLFVIAIIFAWLFIEAILLSTVGTTPGKWLFRIRIAPLHGHTLGYSTALSRSFKVWWRGLGAGILLASLLTLVVAHGNLTKNGMTTWDSDGGFNISHERIGVLRTIVAIVFFTGFFVLALIGNALNA